MVAIFFLAVLFSLSRDTVSQEQEVLPAIYAVDGSRVTLPCPFMDNNTTEVVWKFHKNGTEEVDDAARLYVLPRLLRYITYYPFSVPRERTTMRRANFIINRIQNSEEGEYWCEVISVNVTTLIGPKHPVHVNVIPQNPVIATSESRTLTEFESSKAATCSSTGGKPAATITWYNGTEAMTSSQTLVTVNRFVDYLRDSYRDLVITSPTRYDHNRTFSCVVDHPTYSQPKMFNFTVLVNHSPNNVTMWGNVTLKTAYCEADGGYPEPNYYWTIPGRSKVELGNSTIEVPNMLHYKGDEIFECTVDNGFPPNVTATAVADEMRYPYTKPNPKPNPKLHPAVIICVMLAFVVVLILMVYGVSRCLK